MKKNGFRVLSMILAVFLICNLFSVSFLSVMADEPKFDASNYVNALAGKLPIAIYAVNNDAVNNGNFSPAWALTKLCANGQTFDLAQTYDDKDYPFNKDTIAPFVAAMTDGDTDTVCKIEPEDRNRMSEIIIFDLGEIAEVKAVELISKSYEQNNDVYLSVTRDSLFNQDNKFGVFQRAEAADVTDALQIANQDARYIGIHIKRCDIQWNDTGFAEINVYTEKPFDRSAYANALAGKFPTAVYTAFDGESAISWAETLVISGSTSENAYSGHTYADIDYQADVRKNEIAPHVATMTDESNDTFCRFQPANVDRNDDEIIIYDLGEIAEVKAVELISEFSFLDAEVYLSATRGDLLTDAKKLGAIQKSDFNYSTPALKIAGSDARYVAIRLNYSSAYWGLWDFNYTGFNVVNEIKVYTDKPIDKTAYANALAGKIPTAVYTAFDGESAISWEVTTTISGSTSENAYSGHTYADIDYQADVRKNEIAPHVATMTDESSDTFCRFQPANVDRNDDEIIIYDLGEITEVKAVELISNYSFLDAEIYLSATRGDLLTDAKKLGAIQKSDFNYTTPALRAADSDARYVAIRLNYSSAYWGLWDFNYTGFNVVNEIKVYTAPVTLFDEGEFEGEKTDGCCGSFNIENGTAVGSVKMLEGFSVTLYDGADCTGNSLVFGRNVSSVALLDFGTVASVKIEKADRYIVADANGDQVINIKDLISMKKNAAQILNANLAMDLNNDGRVDVNDLAVMRMQLLAAV